MPKVKQLSNLQKDYTVRKFDKPFKPVEHREMLGNLKVVLYSAPSIDEVKDTMATFIGNTWHDVMTTEFTDEDKSMFVKEVFAGEMLPTTMETMQLVFYIEGMCMTQVTHMLRHRVASFSAQVGGDRSMQDDVAVVPPAIYHQPKYFERYQKVMNDAMQLYHDMQSSGDVCGLDARAILPRGLSMALNMRMNIRDAIGFIRQRIDEQIQPQSDNIVALTLWREIVRRYPFLRDQVNLSAPDSFYVKQCKAQKRNIFPPNKKNDCFDWVEEQFYQKKHRDEFVGGDIYLELRDKLHREIAEACARSDWDPIVK